MPEEVHENLRVSSLIKAGYGKRMAFITIFWTCSIVPLFAVYAFGPKILGALGLTGGLANYGSAFITLMFLVGCVVGLFLVDRIGRRPLIIHSFMWGGVALLLLGIFPDASPYLVLALFAGYAVTIGGTQILQWIYPNELFPTEIRGSAVGLASSLSRIGAAIGTYLVPVSLAHIGIGGTMIVGAVVTFTGAVVSLMWAPETRGLTLGECAATSPQGQGERVTSAPDPLCQKGTSMTQTVQSSAHAGAARQSVLRSSRRRPAAARPLPPRTSRRGQAVNCSTSSTRR